MVQLAKKVFKNTAFNSSSIVISGVGGLIFTIVLARLLHPELFGVYHLAISIAIVMLTFTDLGVNRTMTRYVSYALGKNNKTLARSFFRYLLKIKFFFTLLTTLALLLLANHIATYIFHKPELAIPLQIAGVIIFFHSFQDFFESAFVALQKFQYSVVRSVVYMAFKLTLVPLLILMGYSVCGALVGLSLTIIAVAGVLLFFLVRHYSYLFRGVVVKVERKRVLRFLGYLTFSTLIAGLFFHHIDVIMLGILMTTEDVGFYKAGFNIVIAFIGLISLSTILFPLFTQLNGGELRNAFETVFKYSAIIAFPCAFGLAFVAEPLINLMYGGEYLPAVLPFYLLCLIILTVPMDFFGILFESKEKPQYPAKIIVVASGLNIVLNYFLIIKFGMVGAAIATVTARYFASITLAVLSKRVLNVFPPIVSIYKPLLSSFAMLAFLYFILPKPDTILIGAGGVVIAGFFYLFILALMGGVGRADLKRFKDIFGGGGKK